MTKQFDFLRQNIGINDHRSFSIRDSRFATMTIDDDLRLRPFATLKKVAFS